MSERMNERRRGGGGGGGGGSDLTPAWPFGTMIDPLRVRLPPGATAGVLIIFPQPAYHHTWGRDGEWFSASLPSPPSLMLS